jgi:hypothetical protein
LEVVDEEDMEDMEDIVVTEESAHHMDHLLNHTDHPHNLMDHLDIAQHVLLVFNSDMSNQVVKLLNT